MLHLTMYINTVLRIRCVVYIIVPLLLYITTQNFDVFFLVSLNRLLIKQSNCRRLETRWRPCPLMFIHFTFKEFLTTNVHACMIDRIMHELPWIMTFWSRVICQWCSRVTKSRVKIIGKSHHECPKIVIHANESIIFLLQAWYMSWTHNFANSSHRSLTSPLSLRTVFSDLALRRHHSWYVMSREREVLASWRYIHRSCTSNLAEMRSSLVNNNR